MQRMSDFADLAGPEAVVGQLGSPAKPTASLRSHPRSHPPPDSAYGPETLPAHSGRSSVIAASSGGMLAHVASNATLPVLLSLVIVYCVRP